MACFQTPVKREDESLGGQNSFPDNSPPGHHRYIGPDECFLLACIGPGGEYPMSG